jgi:hypothetical protein
MLSCAWLRNAPRDPSTKAALAPPPERWVPPVGVAAAEAGAGGGGGAADVNAGGDDGSTLPELEPLTPSQALRNAHRHLRDTLLDVYAAFLAFATQLVTAETAMVAGIAVGAVFAFTRWFEERGAGGSHRRVVSNLNWTIFATVVVFPLCARAARVSAGGTMMRRCACACALTRAAPRAARSR